MKTILVTGGAGYIGSAAVKELIKEKYKVIVIDNLSKGIRRLVHKKAKFYKVDLTDNNQLAKVFKTNKIDSVMHFASYKAVGESMENPIKYSDNITGTINLLNQMVKNNVKRIVYSSTASVYGTPEYTPIDEKHPTIPINYYGFTKLQCEKIIKWYSDIHNLNYISLRYFNVAGDAGLKYVDPAPQNVIPIIMETIKGIRKSFTILGKDYKTRDGTCIRDYIDINDLVRAHILALKVKKSGIINLGTSNGVSVKELVETTIKVTKQTFNYNYGKRRPGDPASVLASNKKANKILKWKPKIKIEEMIKTSYQAYN